MNAIVDFDCIEEDCGSTIKFNLLELSGDTKNIACTNCHRIYEFEKDFIAKLEKLRVLILSVRDAEDILDDCDVAIVTPAGEVKLPYRLLLTRLNTLISLDCHGKKLMFNFRVEPLNEETVFK